VGTRRCMPRVCARNSAKIGFLRRRRPYFGGRLSRPHARASSATRLRRRRIIAEDAHRFILVSLFGQALRTAMVPTWPSSGALTNAPAQGFRGRPGLPMVVTEVLDLGAHVPHRKTISGSLQINTMGALYREFRLASLRDAGADLGVTSRQTVAAEYSSCSLTNACSRNEHTKSFCLGRRCLPGIPRGQPRSGGRRRLSELVAICSSASLPQSASS
jgi:hypothetical protein